MLTLAEIPIVRLRHGLPRALLKGQAGFNETVNAVQSSFAPPRLKIDLSTQRVDCGDKEVRLRPALLAWLAWWVSNVLAGRPMQHWSDADSTSFLDIYARVVGAGSDAYEQTCCRLSAGMEKEFFEQNNSRLEGALREQLGLAAAPYLLATEGRRPRTRRGLDLSAEAVMLA